MPYIDDERRTKLITDGFTYDSSSGELAYALWTVIQAWHQQARQKQSFTTMNEVNGVLAGLQEEYYRRYIAPYEETMIKRNGDIPLFPEIFEESTK